VARSDCGIYIFYVYRHYRWRVFLQTVDDYPLCDHLEPAELPGFGELAPKRSCADLSPQSTVRNAWRIGCFSAASTGQQNAFLTTSQGFDLQRVVTAVAILIDPFAYRVAREGSEPRARTGLPKRQGR
jgi:hypothetical protein